MLRAMNNVLKKEISDVIKVILCIPSLISGGAQRFVTELALSLDRKQFDIYVMVTSRLDKTSYYRQLIESNIKVINCSASNYLFTFFKIFYYFIKIRPKIIHSNLNSVFHVFIPSLFFRCAHVFTFHSMASRVIIGTKKKLLKKLIQLKFIVPIAICNTVKKSIMHEYRLEEQQVYCIYNGVNTSKFKQKQVYSDTIKTFINVGTLYDIKNQSMLINAFRNVYVQFPDTILLLVGDGILREQLELQVEQLKLGKSVIFLGERDDIEGILSQADVFCLTSKVEGLPISVLEAMSVGLPIITTPAGGVVDIVENKINGFIVPQGNEEFLSQKMIELIKNPKIAKDMGTLSRKKAIELDELICAKQYQDVYSLCIKG